MKILNLFFCASIVIACNVACSDPSNQVDSLASNSDKQISHAEESTKLEKVSSRQVGKVNPQVGGKAISGVIRKIFEDSKGNLWFGTQNGLCRYAGKSLEYFKELKDENGQGVTIKDIREGADGTIWFGHTGGLSSYNGTSFINYHEQDGLLNHDVWCIEIDKSGLLWIGTLEGVCTYDGEQFEVFSIADAQPDSSRGVTSARIVHTILADSQGHIWIGNNGGAHLYDGETLSSITIADGLCNDNVNQILEDNEGNIWFATTHKGVCSYDGKAFTHYSAADGLDVHEVWELYEDRSGIIWIAGKHAGVYSYDGHSFTHYNESNGLVGPGILSIEEDTAGRLWFGGINALYRLSQDRFIPITSNGPW